MGFVPVLTYCSAKFRAESCYGNFVIQKFLAKIKD